MDDIDAGLEQAGQSLAQFVSGPGQDAANALEAAFSQAGLNIEQVLKQAAQSGELDFRQMTRSILSDLAQIVAEALIARSGLNQVGQTINVSVPLNGAATQAGGLGSLGAVATHIAAAAARGVRYV